MQGMSFFKYTAAAVMAACVVLAVAPATAQSDTAAKLAEKKAAEQKLSKKASGINKEVQGLQKRLVNTTTALRKAENQLAATEKKLAALQKQKTDLSRRVYREHNNVGGLIAAAQRFGRTSTPHLLLQSEPVDAARASLLLKTMIPAMQEKSAMLRGRVAEITRIERDIQRQKTSHASELKRFHKQEEELTKLLEQRRGLYRETESARQAEEAAVAKLARESRNLDDLVQKIKPVAKPASFTAAAPDVAAPKDLSSPVSGTIRTAFGATDDLGAQSRGITYNARAGARVVTPVAGTVRFAGPFKKYRHILIVEHAGGYHSLIAGLGRIDTVVGASLDAGEPIGRVDTSDNDHHPVYYELRHNGTPVNPSKILGRKS